MSWDIHKAVFSRTNGENRGEGADEAWDLDKSNYRCNLFCTGYKRYISAALFSSKEDWLHIDRLYRQISYEHSNGQWTMTLNWNIVSFAELTLTQTGAKSVRLTPKGKYSVSGIGSLPEWTLKIKGLGKETAIPLHENMPEVMDPSLKNDKSGRTRRLELRHAEQFLHFLITLVQKDATPEKYAGFISSYVDLPGKIDISAASARHKRHWQVFGNCWTRLAEYDRFFYITEAESNVKLTHTVNGKEKLVGSISSYQYYVLLYLTCRKILMLREKFGRNPLENPRQIEYFRLAGEAGASALPYHGYNSRDTGLSGTELFRWHINVYLSSLGGS